MKNKSTFALVSHIRDWCMNQIQYGTLGEGDRTALIAEFTEWIEPQEDVLEILSLDEDLAQRRGSSGGHHNPCNPEDGG